MEKKFLRVSAALLLLLVLPVQAQSIKFSAEPLTNYANGPDLLLLDSYLGTPGSYATRTITASTFWNSGLWTNDAAPIQPFSEGWLHPAAITNFGISTNGDTLVLDGYNYDLTFMYDPGLSLFPRSGQVLTVAIGYQDDGVLAAHLEWTNVFWSNIKGIPPQLTVLTTTTTGDGSTLTNLNLRYTTNAIPGNWNVGWGKAYKTNISANSTIHFLSPTNSYFESTVFFLTNGSATDFSVTFDSGVWGTPGSGSPPVYWCTNKMLTRLVAEHYGQDMTNAYKLDFAP